MFSETLKAYLISFLCVILFVCSVAGGILVYRNVNLKLEHVKTQLEVTAKNLDDVLKSNQKMNVILEKRVKDGREYSKQLVEATNAINSIKGNECFDSPHGDSVNELLNSIGGNKAANTKTTGDTVQD